MVPVVLVETMLKAKVIIVAMIVEVIIVAMIVEVVIMTIFTPLNGSW